VKPLAKGTVKRWMTRGGYGFITPDDGGKDVFVHNSDLQGRSSLREGEKVEFEVKSTYKGPAVNVNPVDRSIDNSNYQKSANVLLRYIHNPNPERRRGRS